MYKTFTDTVRLTKPFTLLLGEESREIREPSELTVEREHYVHDDQQLASPGFIEERPSHERISLRVGSELVVQADHYRSPEVVAWLKRDGDDVTIYFHPKYTRTFPIS